MNLYILQYNNYYNRTIKKQDSLTDYLQYQLGNVIQGVAFNPGDGIATQQVVNLSEDQIGDYLLAVNEYNEIDSRWFILDCRRERTGQYTLTLRRDLVADNYSTIIDAPCFIEKATLDDGDPMIYNSEDMTFNQIKTDEYLLKDATNVPWIVGYFASNEAIEVSSSGTIPKDYVLDNITDYEFYQYVNNYFSSIKKNIYNVYIAQTSIIVNPGTGGTSTITSIKKESFNADGVQNGYDTSTATQDGVTEIQLKWSVPYTFAPIPSQEVVYNAFKDKIAEMDEMAKAYTEGSNYEDTIRYLNEKGKVIYETSTGKFYRVEVEIVNSGDLGKKRVDVVSGNLFNLMSEQIANINYNYLGDSVTVIGTPGDQSFKIFTETEVYMMRLVELTEVTATLSVPADRYKLTDAPYDMFCIPYSDDLKIYKNGEFLFNSNKEIAFKLVTELARKYSGESAKFLYDLQLLPYCPARYCIQSDGTFDIRDNDVFFIKQTISEVERDSAIVLFCISSSFSFDIPKVIEVKNKKVSNLVDKWRLCSPNYSGLFEFSPAKNNGVDYFNVDCTYKPHNPYIHINPNFKNLYGQDFNDARGLIVGGDFSLPQTTDAWAQYELSNKNYQQMFDRQIQNMEVNNAVQREQQAWQIASGAIGAGMSGALTGAIAGGPIGALVGGLIGAGTSGLAGWRDYQLSEQLRQEAIDYKNDQFGYQLGNIQALPYGLAKTSAFTYNNKIFPILEYYTCTPQEKTALQNKLYYNGMTVMRIGTIAQFLRSEPSYIKGKLIRLEGTDNNFHVVNEIANEINKGVFI